jgi:hypothetical protein
MGGREAAAAAASCVEAALSTVRQSTDGRRLVKRDRTKMRGGSARVRHLCSRVWGQKMLQRLERVHSGTR